MRMGLHEYMMQCRLRYGKTFKVRLHNSTACCNLLQLWLVALYYFAAWHSTHVPFV
jgi:hypothetical protein